MGGTPVSSWYNRFVVPPIIPYFFIMGGTEMDFIACALRNFKCNDYEGPIEIKNKDELLFYILFQEPELLAIPQSYKYSLLFGLEEVNRIITNFVCFGRTNKTIEDRMKRKILINNFYSYCQIFSNALWFVKDNSVTPYFVSISSDTKTEPEFLRRNVYYSDSETKYGSEITFTLSEITEAVKWYGAIEGFTIKKKSIEVKGFNKQIQNTSDYLSFNIPSFQRAFYLLDTARKTDFLPSKIASYISTLETFYAVEGENKHKTSERTAFLLGNNGEERLKIYKDISEAYTARSKYVHGAYISDDRNKKLPQISKTLDTYVRDVFKVMLLKYPHLNYNSGKNDKVDHAFNEIVLSKE